MAVRAIQTRPDLQIVMVEQIGSVSIFEDGVAIFDGRKRIIGWFSTSNMEHQMRISDILLDILDNPRRAKKPDFSFLDEQADATTPVVTSARGSAAMPQRNSSGTAAS